MSVTDSLTALSWCILSSPFPSPTGKHPIKYFPFDLYAYISLEYIAHGPVPEEFIQTLGAVGFESGKLQEARQK